MKKTYCYVGMILGIALFIVGVIMIFSFSKTYSGSATYDAAFGADFYTDEYEATQNAANNVKNLGKYIGEAVEFAFHMSGIITALLGGVVLCYFGSKVSDCKGEKRSSKIEHTPDKNSTKNTEAEETSPLFTEWTCIKCATKNNGSSCSNCGLTKADSSILTKKTEVEKTVSYYNDLYSQGKLTKDEYDRQINAKTTEYYSELLAYGKITQEEYQKKIMYI